MFSYDEIYEALRNGESSEAIVKSFADAMNKAEARCKADEEAEKAKAAHEKLKSEKRLELAENVALALIDYYETVHEDFEFEFDMEPEDVANMLDSVIDLRTSLDALADRWNTALGQFGGFAADTKKKICDKCASTKDPLDEVVSKLENLFR